MHASTAPRLVDPEDVLVDFGDALAASEAEGLPAEGLDADPPPHAVSPMAAARMNGDLERALLRAERTRESIMTRKVALQRRQSLGVRCLRPYAPHLGAGGG